jgi:hypothetical protein
MATHSSKSFCLSDSWIGPFLFSGISNNPWDEVPDGKTKCRSGPKKIQSFAL